ncbi:hypothetical protein FHS78_003627 [Parvibaculum indicum]|uniref:thioredoxin domain-containing protein n=1 Tax=Parvibaculum indicum TaxID=562969 RepID=UPI00141FEF1A|nr:thioredoxin domain-containing protein [Parvibaculum indicum]NIJ43314.1 hypothetical protein [Parvibaculum indicum]
MSRNFLAEETSPYLLQHKDNPVHWRPWGEDALAAARDEGKPILLSVGYAACHWCHVMAHESFEDEDVAAVMNRLFVPIKVDREERPDIDTIYMSALHMLGEQGGWPLTMFLTPDGEPFWGGTYFPKEPKYGRPGFIQVMEEVARLFREEPGKIEQNRAALAKSLAAQSADARPGAPTAKVPDIVAGKFAELMDPEEGGLKGAPKFPQVGIFSLLWRAHLRGTPAPDGHSFETATTRVLDHMAEGGIYDHLGGGFARYAVDERWLVPHFEKMLYDNAQLIDLYASAWQETGKPLYARRVRETVEWLKREMRLPDGAFAASLDADSEGEEGKFYVWSETEIDEVLGDDAPLFKQAYDVAAGGNWEGTNILNRLHHADTGVTEEEETALSPPKQKLLARRATRIRPGFDDKVLADWNGLMIAALARTGLAFDEPEWIALAADAFRFAEENMTRDGRIHHAWRDGKLQHLAMASDLAFMADAALALHEATFDPRYLEAAQTFIRQLDSHYADTANGGYFFTADDAPGLIVRTRTVYDDATPSANGILPGVLTRLAFLTGDNAYLEKADGLIRAFAGELQRNIFPMGSYIASFETRLHPIQIVLAGEADGIEPLRRAVYALALPNRIVTHLPPDASLPQSHPASGKGMVGGKPTAYVCVGETCSLPVTNPDALIDNLRSTRQSGLDSTNAES